MGTFCSWNLKSRVLESGMQLKESGIPLPIGIQNPSSTDKYQNPVPGIRNPQCGIQNPRLSWIPFLGAICACQWKTVPAPPPPPSVSPSPSGKVHLSTVQLSKKQTSSEGSNWKCFNFPNNYLINDNNRQTISTCFQI